MVDALGPSVVAPGAPTLKLAGSRHRTNRLSSVTLAVELRFAMVTLTDTVPPTTTEPKSMLVGETAMPGVGALFRFSGSLGAMQLEVARVVVRINAAAVHATGFSLVASVQFVAPRLASVVPSLYADPLLKPT